VPNIGAPELLIIVLLVMLLFGAKRLPELSRSLGRSLRIFKAETKGLRDDGDTVIQPTGISAADGTATPAASVPPAPDQQRPPQQ
jgi:sec-independent protein translocase protein TatA